MPRTPSKKGKPAAIRAAAPSHDLYEVEVICAARLTRNRKWEYLIKWSGYTEAQNTWEPEESLGSGCERVLDAFWKHLEGQQIVLKPNPAWIKSETKSFQAMFKNRLASSSAASSKKRTSAETNERPTKKQKRSR